MRCINNVVRMSEDRILPPPDIFCSSREKINTFLAPAKLEGFYCTPQTEVYWGLYEI